MGAGRSYSDFSVLPDLQQVEHIDVKPFDLDELWLNPYTKMVPKSVKRFL